MTDPALLEVLGRIADSLEDINDSLKSHAKLSASDRREYAERFRRENREWSATKARVENIDQRLAQIRQAIENLGRGRGRSA